VTEDRVSSLNIMLVVEVSLVRVAIQVQYLVISPRSPSLCDIFFRDDGVRNTWRDINSLAMLSMRRDMNRAALVVECSTVGNLFINSMARQ
jgi:hypothetical protein